MGKHLILASNSKRRTQLLQDAGYEFDVISPGVDEQSDLKEGDKPQDIAMANAKAKTDYVVSLLNNNNSVVLAADTIVSFRDTIIGKPANSADALRILRMLSGTRHSVITGYCVYDVNLGRIKVGYEITIIVMRKVDDNAIQKYVQSNEGIGKAGAYAIQENGDAFIDHIEGSFSNVVGLPLEKIAHLLEEMGIHPAKK